MHDLPDDHQHGDVLKGLGFVRKWDLAIDAGAHRGIITNLLKTRFTQVVAIEPSELADRITGDNVSVVRKVLGNAPGRCGMAHGKINSGQRHVVSGDEYEIVTLDSLGLAPDFLKIDVEGMEWHVVVGGEQTIRKHRPVIMFEENGLNARYNVSAGEVGAVLESWGATRVLVTQRDRRDQDWFYSW